MEREIANVLKACGLGGFRYVPFPPPVFRVAAMPDREAVKGEPEPVFRAEADTLAAADAPASVFVAPAEVSVVATPMAPAPRSRTFQLLAELATSAEPAAPAAPSVVSMCSSPAPRPRRAARSASSLVPRP